MKTISIIIMMLCSLNAFSETTENSFPELTIVTEDWDPYHYIKDDTIQGSVIDLTAQILKNLGSTQTRNDIKLLPWTRAYTIAQNNPNALIFSMIRKEEREKFFKWIGPIFQIKVYFIARKDRNIVINSKDDIKKYKTAVIKDDASEIYAENFNIPAKKIASAKNWKDSVLALSKGRVDLIINTWHTIVDASIEFGIDPEDFEKVYLIEVTDMFYGFNKDTPDLVVEKFRREFKEIQKSTLYTKISPDF